MQIGEFDSADLEELVDIWNRNLPADPISPARLENRVLLDPNSREQFCLVARQEKRTIGFVIGICGAGWAQAFGVPSWAQRQKVASLTR